MEALSIPLSVFDYTKTFWSVGMSTAAPLVWIVLPGEWAMTNLAIKTHSGPLSDTLKLASSLVGVSTFFAGWSTYRLDMTNTTNRLLYGVSNLLVIATVAKAKLFKKLAVPAVVLTVGHTITGLLFLLCKPKKKTA